MGGAFPVEWVQRVDVPHAQAEHLRCALLRWRPELPPPRLLQLPLLVPAALALCFGGWVAGRLWAPSACAVSAAGSRPENTHY